MICRFVSCMVLPVQATFKNPYQMTKEKFNSCYIILYGRFALWSPSCYYDQLYFSRFTMFVHNEV